MPASKRSRRRHCIASTLLVLLVAPLPASAWQFVNVIDSTGPYSEFTPPGINASGHVAFRAKLDAGGYAIVSGDTAATAVVTSTAGGYSGFAFRVSISDSGIVLFTAELDTGGSGLFTGPDPATDAIATNLEDFVSVSSGAIDAQGNVVFAANVGGIDGIYFGTTALADDTGAIDFFGRPALNDTGTVAFRGTLDGSAGATAMYSVPLGGGPVATIAEADGPFSGFDEKIAINDAGDIVFQASLDDLPGEFESGIFTGLNPATDTVVDTSGPFQLLDDPAITENGTVLFWGALAASGGIFSGPDPVADEVIGSFDSLFGSQVANVNMRSEGYSNGRLAFSYTLTDGRSGIAIAYAPEPAGAASAIAACIALRLLRARRPTA